MARRLWILLFGCAIPTWGCSYVSPPEYQPGAGHSYCAELRRSSHAFVYINTPAMLVLAGATIGFGYLASHFTNDPNATHFFKRHMAAFFFVVAVVSGVVAAYARSRADANSRAASEVQAAMVAKDDRVKYDLCLEAASKCDGSRTDSSAAVSAMASEQAKKTSVATADLADVVRKSADAKAKGAEAAENAAVATEQVLDVVTKTLAADKMTAAKKEIEGATEAIQTSKTSAAVAKSTAQDAKEAAAKVQEKLKGNSGNVPPKAEAPGQ